MYSGSDSTESQTHTQWALNPSAYRNVSNDQVDWAALAQQWIIMKEAGPPVPEQTLKPTKPLNLKEEGEAPMEVERDEGTPTSAGSQQGSDAWNWGQQQQGWNWGASWNVAPTGVPPPAAVKAPLLPTPGGFGQFGGISEGAVDAVAFNASFPSTTTNEYTSGYWTGNSTKIKPHNKRYSKVNVPIQAPTHEPVALDAAKRKQLPAWIREGLEKMERDKQKQLEREREMQQEKEEKVEKVKFTEKDALEIIKSTVKERQKSRFDSDGEDSVHSGTDTKAATPEPPVTPLSQEELLMKVRRMMTEVLLKVTNREIYQICKEELQRHHKKSRASDHRVPASSGNNTSSRLGLGMYGGDSDDSSATEDSVDTKGAENRDYSDSELKDFIKRRKAQFSKTEKEIEERLAEKDHKGNAENRHSTPPERNQNDSQVDAKSQAAKRRHSASNDKTPPPKSTTPEARRRPSRKHSSTSTEDDTDSDRGRNSKKSKKSKRSSSSDSDSNHRSQRKKLTESGRKTSRRSRSRSRSRTRKGTMRSRSRSKRRSRSSNRSDLRKRSRRSRSRSTSRRRSRSRSPHGRSKRRSRSRRRRSDSRSSRRSYRYRRSRSSSSGRGKRSHRH